MIFRSIIFIALIFTMRTSLTFGFDNKPIQPSNIPYLNYPYIPYLQNEKVHLDISIIDRSHWLVNPDEIIVLDKSKAYDWTPWWGDKKTLRVIQHGILINQVDWQKMFEISVTIMPNVGTKDFPFLFMTRNGHAFTAKLVSPPSRSIPQERGFPILKAIDPSGLSIKLEWEHYVIHYEQGRSMPYAVTDIVPVSQIVHINPTSAHIAQGWKTRQQVAYFGMWNPELDPNHREFDPSYPFVLFNYQTKDFVFFNFNL